MVFFDTSVLIAALLPEHPFHSQARQRLLNCGEREGAIGARSLAELYSVLTGLPRRPKISPRVALQLIQPILDRFEVVDLDQHDYVRVIQRAAAGGCAGGRLYDALLVECARKVDASQIFTLNMKDYSAVAPDLAGRILAP